MTERAPYDAAFFNGWAPITATSAQTVVPIAMRLVAPQSVIDVGCGSGLWLEEFRKAGVSDIKGLDGPWVQPSSLRFPSEYFEPRDLTQPLPGDRRYDLAMSLEVAEHLPASVAETFVRGLVSLAPAVMFSASIRGQGGRHHVNEQWPAYWVERFAARGYVAVDAIRPEVWDNPRVAHFYSQNIGIFVQRSRLEEFDELRTIYAKTNGHFPALVHPDTYENALREADDVRGLVAERAKRVLGPLRPVATSVRQRLRHWTS